MMEKNAEFTQVRPKCFDKGNKHAGRAAMTGLVSPIAAFERTGAFFRQIRPHAGRQPASAGPPGALQESAATIIPSPPSTLGLSAPGGRAGTLPTGPADPQRDQAALSADDVESRLKGLDPKLARELQALREFIARFDPAAAKQFDQILAKIADCWDGAVNADQAAVDPAQDPAQAGVVRRERIEIAVEQTVAQVEIALADGTTISAQVVQQTLSVNVEAQLGQSDPLVLDLNGNGIFDTTTPYDGHRFDLLGNGQAVRAATIAYGDGLLALDRNNNGRIDDGSELFGDQNGAPDGFAELRRYDSNRDGVLDVGDLIYQHLQVFRDVNRNGLTDAGELTGLQAAGVAKLLLQATEVAEKTNGNDVVQTATFVRTDGTTGRLGELRLNYLA
jgi:hypothetical protein